MSLFKSQEEKKLRDYYENGIPGIKFIWGIKSGDDISSNPEAGIYTMNDFDIVYYEHDKQYALSVETIYEFENPKDSYLYINGILMAFTKWMKTNLYSTEYKPNMYDLFTKGVNINSRFDSIEEAYGVFKALVQMYGAQK